MPIMSKWAVALLVYTVLVASIMVMALLGFAGGLLHGIGESVALLALLVAALALLLLACLRPTWRKFGVTIPALIVSVPVVLGGVVYLPRLGGQLYFRVHRSSCEAVVRKVLTLQRGDSDALASGGCGPEVTPRDLADCGAVICRADSDRIMLVVGGLLNREQGFLFVPPGDEAPRKGDLVLDTTLTWLRPLDGGWYAYAGR